MKNIHRPSMLLMAALLALVPAALAHAEETTSTIAFSDPTKPGTLKIRVMRGDVVIHGADVKEISVKSDSDDTAPTPRKDGMRVLSTSSSYVLSEHANVVTLEYGGDNWMGGSADFKITVPASTSVVVANAVHGDFECSNITGDIDVRSTHGDVKLDAVTGGALVETVNGEIRVNVKSVTQGHPLSFTSMNGEVEIRVPADLKAAVRFRTHRGTILSNFDDKILVTKTEVSRHPTHKSKDKDKDATVAPEAPIPPVAANAPAEAAAPAAPATPKSDSDDDWRSDVRESVREATEMAADAAREAADAAREGFAEAHIELSHSFDALPPMTGGKTVTGTLNGGGVEIQAATLNGDIILKKQD